MFIHYSSLIWSTLKLNLTEEKSMLYIFMVIRRGTMEPSTIFDNARKHFGYFTVFIFSIIGGSYDH